MPSLQQQVVILKNQVYSHILLLCNLFISLFLSLSYSLSLSFSSAAEASRHAEMAAFFFSFENGLLAAAFSNGRSVLQCVAVRCSVLQCVAVCCSALQCVAVCCSAFSNGSRHSHMSINDGETFSKETFFLVICAALRLCNTLQHTATHCTALQHTVAVCCRVLRDILSSHMRCSTQCLRCSSK